MTEVPLRVLWFDDEWHTARQAALAPWHRALRSLQPQPQLTLCNCIQKFADCLQQCPACYDLLILDVMLVNESEAHYGALGFAGERVDPYDAGAQIAELIRSTSFDDLRLPWLNRHLVTPLLVLSSSPRVEHLVRKKVGRSRMQDLSIVPKSLHQRASTATTEATDDFLQAVRALLRL